MDIIDIKGEIQKLLRIWRDAKKAKSSKKGGMGNV